MIDYLERLHSNAYQMNWIESYDFGIASPSCYLAGFVDPIGAVHIVDGFYKPEMSIKDQVKEIKRIRAAYGAPDDYIYGDPSIFRRTSITTATVGKSTSELFYEEGEINFRRGNNDITNGILKVQSYLALQPYNVNPYTGDTPAPLMYFSDHLDFIDTEITAYMWQKDTSGTPLDKPVDKNDHAMDALKYIMSDRPEIGQILLDRLTVPKYMQWRESEVTQAARYARYGN